MDKFDQILEHAKLPVYILSNGSDLRLEDFDGEPMSADVQKDLLARGFCFLGCMGILEGKPKAALANPVDPATSSLLSQAYVRFVVDRVNRHRQQKGQKAYVLPSLH